MILIALLRCSMALQLAVPPLTATPRHPSTQLRASFATTFDDSIPEPDLETCSVDDVACQNRNDLRLRAFRIAVIRTKNQISTAFRLEVRRRAGRINKARVALQAKVLLAEAAALREDASMAEAALRPASPWLLNTGEEGAIDRQVLITELVTRPLPRTSDPALAVSAKETSTWEVALEECGFLGFLAWKFHRQGVDFALVLQHWYSAGADMLELCKIHMVPEESLGDLEADTAWVHYVPGEYADYDE